MNEIELAKQLLKEEAIDSVTETADRLVAAGRAEWRLDPFVHGVVGLLEPRSNHAFIVVYLKQKDFECSESFDLAMEEV